VVEIEKTQENTNGLKNSFGRFEYEIILFVFLLLRFVFKNLLGYKRYFTDQAIFGLSPKAGIAIGTIVMVCVCLLLAVLFGKLIRRNGAEYEKPVMILTALFFACPATLPFLFDTDSLSGTQMLYPFALFIIGVYFISKPALKWFLPVVCAVYFLPAAIKPTENLFLALYKGALLYVPLLLLLAFAFAMRKSLEPVKKPAKSKKNKTASAKNGPEPADAAALGLGLLVSAGTYAFAVSKLGWAQSFYNMQQKIDGYLFAALVIIAPALAVLGAVLNAALNNKFPRTILNVFLYAPLILVPFCWNNLYGLWVPLVVIALSALVFYGVWQESPAMLSAVRAVGDWLLERRMTFYIVLIAMAALSNASSAFLSQSIQRIFTNIPF